MAMAIEMNFSMSESRCKMVAIGEQLMAAFRDWREEIEAASKEFESEAEVVCEDSEESSIGVTDSPRTMSRKRGVFSEYDLEKMEVPYPRITQNSDTDQAIFENPKVLQIQFDPSKVQFYIPRAVIVDLASKELSEPVDFGVNSTRFLEIPSAHKVFVEMPIQVISGFEEEKISDIAIVEWSYTYLVMFDPGGVDIRGFRSKYMHDMAQMGKVISLVVEASSAATVVHSVIARALGFGFSNNAFQDCKECVRVPKYSDVEGPNYYIGDRFIYCRIGCPILIPFDRGKVFVDAWYFFLLVSSPDVCIGVVIGDILVLGLGICTQNFELGRNFNCKDRTSGH